MRAFVVGLPRTLTNLAVVERSDPGMPGPLEIRVRIRANSLNFHDYGVAIGKLPAADGRVVMADGAGFVEAVGEGVEEFRVGQLVASTFFPDWQAGDAPTADFSRTPGDGIDGYAAETVVRPANWFTPAPIGWSAAEASTIPTAGVTAWRALAVNGQVKAGDDVLVLGTGGVSIYAMQLALATGARVFATSSSDDKLQRLSGLGASEVFNYRKTPEWGEAVRKATNGRGVDHVIDVGGPAPLPQSMIAARIGGHIALIGVLTGLAGTVPTVVLMSRQQRLVGLTVGSRRHQQDLVRALDATGIRPMIDRSFPFDELPDAFAYQASGQHFGKICIEF
jgi:NADPH:quinone reductase-like Zn-dependent oxidoreductase